MRILSAEVAGELASLIQFLDSLEQRFWTSAALGGDPEWERAREMARQTLRRMAKTKTS